MEIPAVRRKNEVIRKKVAFNQTPLTYRLIDYLLLLFSIGVGYNIKKKKKKRKNRTGWGLGAGAGVIKITLTPCHLSPASCLYVLVQSRIISENVIFNKKNSNYQMKYKKKVMFLQFNAIVMIAILLVAIISAVLIYRNIVGKEKKEEEIAPPDVYIEADKNYPVSLEPNSNNEPHIAVSPVDSNVVVAGGNDYNTPLGDSWCGAYWSDDGGRNWTTGFIPGYPGGPTSVLTGYEGAGDPVLAFDSNGNCYYSGIAFKRPTGPLRSIGRSSAIFVAKSEDGGKTWPQITIPFQGITRASFHDKEWIAVDPETGYVYIVWALFSLYAASQMLFSRSTDQGQTWSRPYVITDIYATEFSVQGAAITVDADGIIHIIWIDFENEQMRYTYSTDKGGSFADPKDVTSVRPIPREGLPNTNYRTPTLPALAVDRSDGPFRGRLYATWNDYRNGDADSYLVYSDDGNTWSEAIRVNDDPEGNGADQFFSTVAVSPQGAVQLIFYDRREDPDNTLLSVYYAISLDGGDTYYNMNITDTSFNGDHSRGPFMGDYIGIASTEDVAHAIWADTRHGSADSVNSDLYSARILISEIDYQS
jgi:hypothetical protein